MLKEKKKSSRKTLFSFEGTSKEKKDKETYGKAQEIFSSTRNARSDERSVQKYMSTERRAETQ